MAAPEWTHGTSNPTEQPEAPSRAVRRFGCTARRRRGDAGVGRLNRVVERVYGEVIGAALDVIPARIADRVRNVNVLAGVDPVFAGLHRFVDIGDGRSYRDTAHVVYPSHIIGGRSERRTHMVLPTRRAATIPIVVHELGHVLDKTLGFDLDDVTPVSWYAETNRYEAFAEAFTSYVLPGYADRPDDRTWAFFDVLAS